MVNYPTSLDVLTNPVAADPTTSVSVPHAKQHADANDILEALEAKLGIGVSLPDAQYKTPLATAAGVVNWGYYGPVVLADVVASGSSPILEVTGIPANFRNLHVYFTGRSTDASLARTARLTFEATPTVGSYYNETMTATATAVSASENVGVSDFIPAAVVPAASAAANLMASSFIQVFEYSNTGIYKPVLIQSSQCDNIGTGGLTVSSIAGVWTVLSAISRVRLTASAGNWTSQTRLIIIGIPG